ncbi:hypothetical protein ABZ883_33955 [Streptomyces sp. NPDC046977]|uniref:hypothetical protein n=1 Tax=Streptomyces sp. NPDC046977 TaxID=3154703 RepID=UPI00340AC798
MGPSGCRSYFSDPGCAVRPYPEGTPRPGRPGEPAARQDGDRAVLSWQPVPGATGYLVLRDWQDAAHPGTRVQDQPVTGTTVTDTAAPAVRFGAYYAVVAVDADGVRSEAAVLPWTGDGYVSHMTLAANGSADGVRLTWAWVCPYDSGCPEPYAVTVRRWNPATQVWDEVTPPLPGTAVSYLDTTAPAGATSSYQVLIQAEDSEGSHYVIGEGAVPGTRPAPPAAG